MLSVIGGFILGIVAWELSPAISFTYFLSGVISCVVFFATGRILETVLATSDEVALLRSDIKAMKSQLQAAVSKEEDK